MAFERASAAEKQKPDAAGKVVVKVILQDQKKAPGQPVVGNRRYDVVLENTTVSAVEKAIEQALFGGKVK